MAKKKENSEKKKKKVWILQQQIISTIRRLFVKSPIFSAIKKANRRQYKAIKKNGDASDALRWEYQCAHCKKWFPEKTKGKVNIAVDHVSPVIDPKMGLQDWNTYVERMFAGFKYWDEEKGFDIDIYQYFQILCKSCHDEKSKNENKLRRESKKKVV